ncbi:Cytochrome P450 [Corchorus olitorius]|uniref:Cytochrome P450 n=1 Tax=Corchorus olitorius TaxID=93759 RepID=A0A1R3IG86_9ROSI|nr:Cytochrome P450 [Corchorus olitorius]
MLLRLGRLSTIVISSADAASVILKDHDLDCCSRPFLVGPARLSYNCLDITFSPYCDYWREIRKLCVVELFSLKRVQSYRFIREEEVSSMIDSISRSSNSGTTPVNLTEKPFSLTANNIFRMAFGKKTDKVSGFKNNDGFEGIVREAMAVLGSFAASEFVPYVGWIIDRLTGLHQKIENVFHKLDALYEQVLADHLNPGRTIIDGHEDIVDVLLRIQRDGVKFGGAPLSNDSVMAVITAIYTNLAHRPIAPFGFSPTNTDPSCSFVSAVFQLSRPFLIGPGRLSYNCSDISFSPYGDYWREMRKLCVVELFSLRRVQSYRFIREEEVASMIDSISQSSHSGTTPVNLTEKVFSLMANNIFRMAFGKKTFEESGYKSNDGLGVVREAVLVLGSLAASEFFPYVGWIVDRLSGLHQRFENVFHKLDALFEQVLDDHLNPGRTIIDGHEDIVDVLLRIQRDGVKFGGAPLSNDSIKAVIMGAAIATGSYSRVKGGLYLVLEICSSDDSPEIPLIKFKAKCNHFLINRDL